MKEQFFTVKQLMNIAENAGDFVIDAKFEIFDFCVACNVDSIPVKPVIDILSNYDIDLEDVNFEREDENKTLSIEDII
jgi:hypothetical protein